MPICYDFQILSIVEALSDTSIAVLVSPGSHELEDFRCKADAVVICGYLAWWGGFIFYYVPRCR